LLTVEEDAFHIDYLYPPEVDTSVFYKVVLDETKKDVIKTLVESHKERRADYDDLISGKGENQVDSKHVRLLQPVTDWT